MNAAQKIEKMVELIEAGKTLHINAMGAQFKLKKTYAAYKHFGADIFFANADGVNVHIRSGKTSGRITACAVS